MKREAIPRLCKEHPAMMRLLLGVPNELETVIKTPDQPKGEIEDRYWDGQGIVLIVNPETWAHMQRESEEYRAEILHELGIEAPTHASPVTLPLIGSDPV